MIAGLGEVGSPETVADHVASMYNLVPPIDVMALAWRLGLSVNYISHHTDGFLVGGKHVFINADTAYTRRRFTLAHEIGHYILGHQGAASGADERAANRFAARLLMPRPYLEQVLGNCELNIDLIQVVADGCQVSTAAAAIEAIDLCSLPQVLYLVREAEITYARTAPGVGAALRSLRRGASVPADSSYLASRSRAETGEAVGVEESSGWLSVGGATVQSFWRCWSSTYDYGIVVCSTRPTPSAHGQPW